MTTMQIIEADKQHPFTLIVIPGGLSDLVIEEITDADYPAVVVQEAA